MSHGNKYLFLVAALALAAPVLYQYGPDFTRDVEQVAAQKADIAAAVAATVINSQAAQPQAKSSPAAASLQVLKESTQQGSTSGAKEAGSKSNTRARVGSKDAPQKTPSRVERKSSAASVRGKHTPDVVPTVSATHAAELENPRDKRWLKGLTGSRIRFGMERGARSDSCATPGSCEPVGNSENVSVVGVVVDADKLQRLPMGEGVIQGKVRQGHWSDNKPVVYMQ